MPRFKLLTTAKRFANSFISKVDDSLQKFEDKYKEIKDKFQNRALTHISVVAHESLPLLEDMSML